MKSSRAVRQGWSLIEVVTAVTLGSVIFGLAMVVAHGFFRLDQSLQTERQTWASLDRLADQFRDDAHAAKSVALAEPKRGAAKAGSDADAGSLAVWTFHLAGQRQAQYTVSTGGVTRIERVAGKVLSREGFSLPPGATAKLELPAPPGRLVALRIVPEELGGRAPAAQPMRIMALVGFDHRFASKGAQP